MVWKWLLFIFLGIPALVMFGVLIEPGALVGFQGLTPHLLVFGLPQPSPRFASSLFDPYFREDIFAQITL